MTRRTWAEIEAGRTAEVPEPALPDTLELAVKRICGTADWIVIVEHFRTRLTAEAWAQTGADPSAFWRDLGRRTLFREIEQLSERVTSDRRNGQRGNDGDAGG